jgi:hypothetical protein
MSEQETEIDPWRDPEYYKVGQIVACLGCGLSCHKTRWGAWCYDCNVERIERISKSFASLKDPRP